MAKPWQRDKCSCQKFVRAMVRLHFEINVDKGRFPFTKKFGNFLLGISVWEKRVPFFTSPILGRPGRLIDCERHGTGDEANKSVNGIQIFHWKVSTRKKGLPFQEFHLFWKISRGMNQKVVFHLQPDRNFRNYLVNGKRSRFFFIPPNLCSDWRRMCHVSWVKLTNFLGRTKLANSPRRQKTWTFQLHIIRWFTLKLQQICVPGSVVQIIFLPFCSIFELGSITKHLVIGPMGNGPLRVLGKQNSPFSLGQVIKCLLTTSTQPSQNVLAAGHLAVYNKISAAHFCRLLSEALAASASAAYYNSQLAYYSETYWLGWALDLTAIQDSFCSILLLLQVLQMSLNFC